MIWCNSDEIYFDSSDRDAGRIRDSGTSVETADTSVPVIETDAGLLPTRPSAVAVEEEALIFSPDPEWVELVEEALAVGRQELGLNWKVGEGGVRVFSAPLEPFNVMGRATSSRKCKWSDCNKVAKIRLHPTVPYQKKGKEFILHELLHVASAWGWYSDNGGAHLPKSNLMDIEASSPKLTERDASFICSTGHCIKDLKNGQKDEGNFPEDGGTPADSGE